MEVENEGEIIFEGRLTRLCGNRFCYCGACFAETGAGRSTAWRRFSAFVFPSPRRCIMQSSGQISGDLIFLASSGKDGEMVLLFLRRLVVLLAGVCSMWCISH